MSTKGFFKKIPRDNSPLERAFRLLDQLQSGKKVSIPHDMKVEQKEDKIIVTVQKNK